MPRPPKCRRVEFMPEVTVFKPAGVRLAEMEEEILLLEELEALRLKDVEGLEQEECADRMQVSRPTFQRVLSSAREKVARALVEGKAIRIEGGSYRLAARKLRCEDCSYEFEAPVAMYRQGAGAACPRCGAHHGRRNDGDQTAGGMMHHGRCGRGWKNTEGEE